MKILFYIEPHPVRNSLSHFSDIAMIAGKLAKEFKRKQTNYHLGVDFRIFVTEENVAPNIGEFESIKEYLITPHIDESLIIEQLNVDWDEVGIDLWQDLMNGSGIANYYVEVLKNVHSKYSFDTILYWGQNGAVEQFCKIAGVFKINLELGCTRHPNRSTYVMDPYGVNGAAATANTSIDFLKSIVGETYPKGASFAIRHGQDLEINSFLRRFDLMDNTILQVHKSYNQDKTAFVPLQLYDDANLLQFSAYNSPKEFLEDIAPTLNEHGIHCIVKSHPGSKFRPKGLESDAECLRALNSNFDSFTWIDSSKGHCTNESVFNLSKYVITINSSVGFEALLHNKIVVVQGDAIYKMKNVYPTLRQALSETFSFSQYSQKARLVTSILLDTYLVDDEEFFDLDMLLHRIRTIKSIYTSTKTREEYVVQLVQNLLKTEPNKLDDCLIEGLRFPVPGDQTVRLHKVGNLNSRFTKLSPVRMGANTLPEPSWHLNWWRRLLINVGSWLFKEKTECYVLYESGLFDQKYYFNANPDVEKSVSNAAKHYIQFGEREGRQPSALVNKKVLHTVKRENRSSFQTLLADYAMGNVKEVQARPVELPMYTLDDDEMAICVRARDLLRRRGINGMNERPGLVCHIYYNNLGVELIRKIIPFREIFDIYFTMPPFGMSEVKGYIDDELPNAFVLTLPNRGRDIGPFMWWLNYCGERYETVLKLHTKMGFFQDSEISLRLGDSWRDHLLETLMPDINTLKDVSNEFSNSDNLKMVCAKNFLVSLQDFPTEDQTNLLQNLLSASSQNSKYYFAAGSMFWARVNPLMELARRGVNIESFMPGSGDSTGNFAHVIERALGILLGGTNSIALLESQGADRSFFYFSESDATQKDIGSFLMDLTDKNVDWS